MPASSTPHASAWGSTSKLDAFESLMWRMDDFPGLRASVVGIEMLERAPDWATLQRLHQKLVEAAPRLRQHPVEPALGVGNLHWETTPDFALDRHLSRVSLPQPGSHRQLLDVAQALALEPFDKQQPPWEAVLVNGLEKGQAAYIIKLHHSVSDGKGIVQLLSLLHESAAKSARKRPRRGKKPPAPGAAPPPPPPSRSARLARYAASARRVLAPYAVQGSPLLAARSHQWHFETLTLPFAGLRAAAKAADASLNDAFIAGILGGFRLYHARHGVVPAVLPVTIPISTRAGDTPGGGNHFVAGSFAAPLAEPDPVKRMRIIGNKVKQWRAEPALDLSLKIMPLLANLPRKLVAETMLAKLARQDLQLSNVPGIRQAITLAGVHVTALYPFAPMPGCAAMIAMVSHEEHCCFGFNLDAAAVAHPDELIQNMREAFDEIIAAGTSSAGHGRRSGH